MVSLVKMMVFATITLAAVPAFPQILNSREEALAALGNPDPARRAEGVVWIARQGGAADDAPLYERLRDESPMVRSFAEQALWLVWSRSGDAAVDRLMERGLEEMHAERHREAITTFSEVIRRRPAFAEGWNKRATVLYLAGEYRRSLADCNEVLKRKPRHFGALSGAGLNHLKLEQHREALQWFRRALEVNPNMPGVKTQVEELEGLLRDRST
jgi:tetratricopeptide (TPR) repeat protein